VNVALSACAVMLAAGLGSCGATPKSGAVQVVSAAHVSQPPGQNGSRTAAAGPLPVASRTPSSPVLIGPGRLGSAFRVIVTVKGRNAAWLAQRSGVTLVRFDQSVVQLALHAGSLDPGGSGWRYGDAVGRAEVHHLVAAFNGGFRLNTGAGGFFSQGRNSVPLQRGLASAVTYSDGTTQIGAWHEGVPAAGKPIFSVRQNLPLLVNHGRPAATVGSCARSCWGATLGGGVNVARSALGITSDGALVYAAGPSLSPATLADAMAGAGVQRAMELDINPEWVAGYVNAHHGARPPAAVPLVPGQSGIAGQFLQPYSRDFFTIVARP
jgi:Phosphodiester glycosidase